MLVQVLIILNKLLAFIAGGAGLENFRQMLVKWEQQIFLTIRLRFYNFDTTGVKYDRHFTKLDGFRDLWREEQSTLNPI